MGFEGAVFVVVNAQFFALGRSDQHRCDLPAIELIGKAIGALAGHGGLDDAAGIVEFSDEDGGLRTAFVADRNRQKAAVARALIGGHRPVAGRYARQESRVIVFVAYRVSTLVFDGRDAPVAVVAQGQGLLLALELGERLVGAARIGQLVAVGILIGVFQAAGVSAAGEV